MTLAKQIYLPNPTTKHYGVINKVKLCTVTILLIQDLKFESTISD